MADLRRTRTKPQLTFGTLVTLVATLYVGSAEAYTFTPTEAEWATWPGYCKARYSETMWVSQTNYANRISKSEIGTWSRNLGSSFESLHHYCAGIVYLDRLRLTSDEHQRTVMVGHAIDELTYSYTRVSKDIQLYATVATKLALAYRANDDLEKAKSILKSAIDAQPASAEPYAVLSVVYRELGQPDEQLQALEQGNANTSGESAEINYFLGMYYLNAERYDEAKDHATVAYALGYPLPGLRNKLQRKGHPMASN